MKILKWLIGGVVAIAAIAMLSNPGAVSEGFDEGMNNQLATATPQPTPAPTPTVIEREVEVEVPVTPDECVEALDLADEIIQADADLILDILHAYVDYPDENLGEFGSRVETILDNGADDYEDLPVDDYFDLALECRMTGYTGASA